MNVVGLKGAKINAAGVDEDMLAGLRDLVEMAERGEIKGFAAVIVHPNGDILSRVRMNHCRHALIAGTVYLQHDLSRDHD